MGTKQDWDDQVKTWRLHYLENTPVDRIRTKWLAGQGGVAPAWDTVKRMVDEFPRLTEAQARQLPDALQERWRELQTDMGTRQPGLTQAVSLHPVSGENRGSIDAIVSMPGLGRRYKAWLLHKLGFDEEEIAEKLGVSSESVRHYIEDTEKEMGKVKPKELKETLDVIELMGRFLDCLRTSNPYQILPGNPILPIKPVELRETLSMEEAPLFAKLRKSLDNKFWRKFADWKKARGQYYERYNSFLDAVRQRAEEESQMKITDSWEEGGLSERFRHRICMHVIWKTNPKSLSELADEFCVQRLSLGEMQLKVEGNRLMAGGDFLANGEAVDLNRASKAYWSLVTQFTSVGEQIWELWQELDKTERFLKAQAEAVLPKRFRYRGLEF